MHLLRQILIGCVSYDHLFTSDPDYFRKLFTLLGGETAMMGAVNEEEVKIRVRLIE